MFTLCAYHENINTAVLDYITAAADPHVRVLGDDILVPSLSNLMGAFALGATMTQAQLSSPSLRRLSLLDVQPFNIGAEPVDTQLVSTFQDYFSNPIPLVQSEALNALINQGAGGAERETVLVWFGDKVDAVPDGPRFTLRFTNATTLVAYAWTAGALTFTQAVPAGRYAVIGGRAVSAGLIAFRLIFPGGGWRPGAIGVDLGSDAQVQRFRNGNAGSWGEFEHDLPPIAEFFSVSADTAQVVHLDLVQIREGRG
jgi:hypothetical protein